MYRKQTEWAVYLLGFALALQALAPAGAAGQNTRPVPLDSTIQDADDKALQAKIDAVSRELRADPRLQVKINVQVEDQSTFQEALSRVQKATGVVLRLDKDLEGKKCGETLAINVPAWQVLADLAVIDLQDGSWQKVDDGYLLRGKPKPSNQPPPKRVPRSRSPAAGQFAEDFQQVFRDGLFDQSLLKFAGPDAETFVHREAEGLRITLPAGKGPEAGVGVALRRPVRGDCEITAAFTILQTEPPKSGYGSGVLLQVIKDSDTQAVASITRTWRPTQGEGFVANWVSKQGNKPLRQDLASKAKSGKLRLTRQGALLHFLIAEGSQDSFREIYQVNFGSEDLRAVRLIVDTGRANNLLDVRLESLSLRTGNPTRASVNFAQTPVPPPDPPKASTVTPEPAQVLAATPAVTLSPESPTGSSSTGWMVWIVAGLTVGLLVLAGCLVGGWFWLRNQAATSRTLVAKPKRLRTS